jgi:hypothetical protein
MTMSDQAKGPTVAAGDGKHGASESRRRALARLGLASLAAYSAPSIVRIDRTARAAILPPECEPPPDFPPGFPPLCP